MPEATQRFFDHLPESVRAARDFTTRTLSSWGLDDTGDIRLAVSELATNALAHGSDDEHGFLVRLEPTDGGVRLEVHDSGDPHQPPPGRDVPEPTDETGRGLVIVAALAARWGIAPRRPSGKVVWSHFPTALPAAFQESRLPDVRHRPEHRAVHLTGCQEPPRLHPADGRVARLRSAPRLVRVGPDAEARREQSPPPPPTVKGLTMNVSGPRAPQGTFTIGKTFVFEAGHRLPGLPPEHKCSRQHGHSYEVEVVLTAPTLEEPGFVTDFAALAPFKKFLDTELDHHNLHKVLDFEPTSERLARFLAGWFIENVEPGIPGRLVAVRVRETARSWARFDVEGR